MDYQRIYNQFISDRRANEQKLIASDEYKESHHIIPRALGGGNNAENLIYLRTVDHIHAHLLLAKIHGGKLWWAVRMMTSAPEAIGRKIPEKLRISSCAAVRRNARHSEETKAKMSASAIGRVMSDAAKEKLSVFRTGSKREWLFTDENRKKLSEALRGRILSESHRKKIVENNTGRLASDKTRALMSKLKSGDANPNARDVLMDGNNIFGSRKSAASFVGISVSTFKSKMQRGSGKNVIINGHVFSYTERIVCEA